MDTRTKEIVEQNLRTATEKEKTVDAWEIAQELGLPLEDLRVRDLVTREYENPSQARETLIEAALHLAYKNPSEADLPSRVAPAPAIFTGEQKQIDLSNQVSREIDAALYEVVGGQKVPRRIDHNKRISIISDIKARARKRGWKGY